MKHIVNLFQFWWQSQTVGNRSYSLDNLIRSYEARTQLASFTKSEDFFPRTNFQKYLITDLKLNFLSLRIRIGFFSIRGGSQAITNHLKLFIGFFDQIDPVNLILSQLSPV